MPYSFAKTFSIFLIVNAMSAPAEVLYNGIELPSPWPPPRASLSLEPQRPPYLEHPPAVIPIDIGRQLFVDDFLIESHSLRRVFHQPEYHPACPVLKPDRPWEQLRRGRKQGPAAMPFSDGVWFDPKDGLFKMWYYGDYSKAYLCYATSRDGIHWEKPQLDVEPGTNIVLKGAGSGRTVWLDLEEKDPSRRFKLVSTRGGSDLLQPEQEWFGSLCTMYVYSSPDGIHWSGPVSHTGPTGDRNSAFWNPFRRTWVFSIREYSPFGGRKNPMRCRRYWESADLVQNLPWKYREPTMWVGADNLDLRSERVKHFQPELYNLDAVGYESLMIGLFSILREPRDEEKCRPKINQVCLGFSRDGFHWDRPVRQPFLPVSDDRNDWNWGNVQSAGGCCLVVGDQLYFYVSGRKGVPENCDAGCSTGLAVLRRDGFASLDAGREEGSITTRPLRFKGKYLFVNASCRGGELRAEILDAGGHSLQPFSKENCLPVSEDRTFQRVRWESGKDLSALAGKPVRFRFHLRNGQFYSFWVSPEESGASHGYIAAGGPGFITNRDTVGRRIEKGK